MDRDEALEYLVDLANNPESWEQGEHLKEAIAALSDCACRGRGPIAVVKVTLRKHPEQHTHFAILPIYYQPEGDGPFDVEAIIFEEKPD